MPRNSPITRGVILVLGLALGLEAAEVPRPERARLEVLREGPGDGRCLTYAGKPVLLIGDSVTQGWVESGEDFDAEAWIRALDRRGIRALLLWSFIAPGGSDDARLGYDALDLQPWASVGPRRWDLLRWNERYFARLRGLCGLAEEKGIIVVITVFDGWTKTRFATHPFNEANGGPLRDRSEFVDLADAEREMPREPADGWGRRERNQFFQERFAARLLDATAEFGNVVYELFNEGEWYDAEARRRHELHFLAFFRARSRNLLVSNVDHISGADFRSERRADISSHHRPNWSTATRASDGFEHFRREFDRSPRKPLLFSEPVPEFRASDLGEVDALTRLLWGTALAGAGFLVQNDASFGFNPRSGMAARAKLRDAMLDREGACSRFFNAMGVEWVSLRPDPRVASTRVAMASSGREYVVYSEGGRDFTMDLEDQAGLAFEGRFYDPRTGEILPVRLVPGGSPTERIGKPDERDWVFWLRLRAGAARR